MNEGLEENTQTDAWGKNDGKYSKANERQKKTITTNLHTISTSSLGMREEKMGQKQY